MQQQGTGRPASPQCSESTTTAFLTSFSTWVGFPRVIPNRHGWPWSAFRALRRCWSACTLLLHLTTLTTRREAPSLGPPASSTTSWLSKLACRWMLLTGIGIKELPTAATSCAPGVPGVCLQLPLFRHLTPVATNLLVCLLRY